MDSFAYDGQRVKKWNDTKETDYGEMWAVGDVIGVCIDCGSTPSDAASTTAAEGEGASKVGNGGTITFYRNGVSMGTAFEDVPVAVRDLLHSAASFGSWRLHLALFG